MSAAHASPRKILVVDDESFVCEAIQMMLEFDGHEVVTVSSGPKALELLNQHDFDLVITDFSMPDMDGTELARELQVRKPHLPVIMVTAFKERLTEPVPGVQTVISKPFLLENLRAAIGKALQQN